MAETRRFKLKETASSLGYPSLIKGEAYQEDYRFAGKYSIADVVRLFPNDWEEIKPPKKQ